MKQQGITIDLTSMASAADSIDRAADNIAARLDDLKGYTNRATSDWEGSTRDAYMRLQADWNRSQEELTANLRKIATALRNTRARFEGLENRSTSLMG